MCVCACVRVQVRKAYFKMSMRFHPDKNPEGRDMFEKVNKAYEFVSSMENRHVLLRSTPPACMDAGCIGALCVWGGEWGG